MVRTDFVGDRYVDWTVSERCPVPGLFCNAPQEMSFSVQLLRGGVSWGTAYEAFLSESASRRDELLAFDARLGGVASPRYQLLGSISLAGATPGPVEVGWRPCSSPDEFTPLMETAMPMRDGDTFVLQYGVQADAGCALQRPGLLAGTSAPGCTIQAEVYVDRLVGTLLMEPSSASASCTAP